MDNVIIVKIKNVYGKDWKGNTKMSIKWVNNKYGGQKDGYVDGKRLFIACQNSYGRKLWQFEHVFNGRILDKAGNDCFTLAIGKSLCLEKLKTCNVGG